MKKKIELKEAMVKRGGVNNNKKTPRPPAPKAQGSNSRKIIGFCINEHRSGLAGEHDEVWSESRGLEW